MVIHWIIVIAMVYVAYVVLKNLWRDNACSKQHHQNLKQSQHSPTYTYTATPNKTTSTTRL